MHNENKVPLIRLAKRDMMEPWKVWCIRLASIVLALLLGGLVMMIALPDGATPIDGYATIITGALGKKTAIRQTVKLAAHNGQARLLRLMCATQLFFNLRNLFFECAYDRDGCHAIPQIRANCLSTVWYQHFGSFTFYEVARPTRTAHQRAPLQSRPQPHSTGRSTVSTS